LAVSSVERLETIPEFLMSPGASLAALVTSIALSVAAVAFAIRQTRRAAAERSRVRELLASGEARRPGKAVLCGTVVSEFPGAIASVPLVVYVTRQGLAHRRTGEPSVVT
jgi:hypothetical protein